jgi:hypothetical protein
VHSSTPAPASSGGDGAGPLISTVFHNQLTDSFGKNRFGHFFAIRALALESRYFGLAAREACTALSTACVDKEKNRFPSHACVIFVAFITPSPRN